jgi:hypothetical protein
MDNFHVGIDKPIFEAGLYGWIVGFQVTGPVAQVTLTAFCFDNPSLHQP